jgi:hypothetical protein
VIQGGAGVRPAPLVLRSTVKDASKPLWKIPVQAELGRGTPRGLTWPLARDHNIVGQLGPGNQYARRRF